MKYVFDLETYPNMFLASFKCIVINKYYEFEISDRKSDLTKLRKFLYQKGLKLIGFNNLNFDYPVLHNSILSDNTDWNANQIYKQVELIINSEYSAIWDNQVKIPQLDLYKIWHYDNAARRTSLKWLEFAMRMENIEDLPYKPGTILTYEQMDHVIEYCRNDLDATYEFYNKSIQNITFRVNMTKELNHNVMNYSDVKIGEYINQKTYERISGRDYKDFKDLRTYRSIFHVKDLIPDYIEFKTDYMNEFLNKIKNKSFKPNEDFEYHLHFAGIEIKFAKGGLHSVDKPLDIKCPDDSILQEKDVGSMYPGSIINGKFYPEHLGEEWYLGIKHLFDERAYKIKPEMKNHDKSSPKYQFLDAKQGAYKLGMNGGGYGKTGSAYSWQYDPMVIMKTTFKGQLSLLMLIEDLYLAGCKIISANTDGVVTQYKKSDKHLVDKLHKDWEDKTKYILENTNYNRIVFRDVNNYVAFIIDNNENHLYHKFKGCFEIDPDYHKNHSKRIIAIALANYFIEGISPKETMEEHFNIARPEYSFCKSYGMYDFCIGVKMKGSNVLYSRTINGINIIDKELSKTNRYYISNNGCELIKKLPPLEKNYLTEAEKHNLKTGSNQLDIFSFVEDVRVEPQDRESNLEAGWKCTLFNKYKESDNYDINYDYYIKECNKIINNIK